MSGDPIVIHADAFVSRYHVRPEARAEFVRRFDALWQADVAGLETAIHFAFHGWGRDENEFVAIASWKNEEAVAALRATGSFKQAVTGLLSCCDRPMEMNVYAGMASGSRDLFATHPAGPSAAHPTQGDLGVVFL